MCVWSAVNTYPGTSEEISKDPEGHRTVCGGGGIWKQARKTATQVFSRSGLFTNRCVVHASGLMRQVPSVSLASSAWLYSAVTNQTTDGCLLGELIALINKMYE